MNCRRAGKMIPLFAGGELPDKTARRLERHLAGCPDCRETAEEFRSALEGIRTALRLDGPDWPEAEWKSLMTRIESQPAPGLVFPLWMNPRPAWAYGAAALLLLTLSAIMLKTRLFPPSPVPPAETLASTEVRQGRHLEFPESRFPRLRQDIPFQVRAEEPRSLEERTLIARSAGQKEMQNILSMTLVSQETGLKVHWTFNRNFEWKEEEKR